MRFDDSLKTVLAADMTPGFGAQSAWRQLVDLAGRGRVSLDPATLDRMRTLRSAVPLAVRAASARALAFSHPGAALVALFAEDDLAAAAPVLRTAQLPAADWVALLPRLTPVGRSILRGRRDLPAEVERGLESFGRVDFALPYEAPAAPAVDVAVEAAPAAIVAEDAAPAAELPTAAPRSPSPFVPLGEVAQRLPVVAEALRRRQEAPASDRFEIADIVARIDAFRRDHHAPADPAPVEPPSRFRFHTDERAVIRWVEGAGRATLIGVSLARAGSQGLARIDAAVAGATRARGRIEDGRLEIDGAGELAGSWRITAQPDFDAASGRFLGFAGEARRPARHQQAERDRAVDGLRQLVHELRTPANAVSGFAEFIEAQLLGPVPDLYRARAGAIRRQAGDLLAAIEDLDTAARIESGALRVDLGAVALRPLLAHVADELALLAAERGATLSLMVDDLVVASDRPAVERLLARLLSASLSAAEAGERLGVAAGPDGRHVAIVLDLPARLAGLDAEALFRLSPEGEEEGGPLLGLGFTLRLARNLAAELGGTLALGGGRLTLRLPTVSSRTMGQASTN